MKIENEDIYAVLCEIRDVLQEAFPTEEELTEEEIEEPTETEDVNVGRKADK